MTNMTIKINSTSSASDRAAAASSEGYSSVTSPLSSLIKERSSKRRGIKDFFRRTAKAANEEEEDDDETRECTAATEADTTTVSSMDTSSVARQVDEELAELGEFELQIDDDSFKYNFKEFIEKTLAAAREKQQQHQLVGRRGRKAANWRGTSTLLASKNKLTAAIHEDFTEILLDQSCIGREGVAVQLLAAHHIVQELIEILPLVRQNTSMASSVEELLFDTVQEYIHPRITDYYINCNLDSTLQSSASSSSSCDLSAGDAAKIAAWIENHLELVASNHICSSPSNAERFFHNNNTASTTNDWCANWSKDRGRLLAYYMEHGVRREMRTYLARLMSCTSERAQETLRVNQQGHAVSGMAQEVIFCIDAQISVARDTLPSKYTERVLHICNQELRNAVVESMMEIGQNWQQLSTMRYCALVNDTALLAEMVEERSEQYLTKPATQFVGQAVTCELSQLGLHAILYLSQRIISDLSDPADPVLTSIGDAKWQNQATQSPIEQTIATLQDFFSDLEPWLSGNSYHFPKVLKHLFDLTLKTYIESFYANTMKYGVKEAAQVADELNQDYVRLAFFFNGKQFQRYHGVAGYYEDQVINSKLYIMRCLSKLIHPKVTAEDSANEVKLVIQEFQQHQQKGARHLSVRKSSGHAAKGGDDDTVSLTVLHVVGLRGKQSSRESLEWLRVVSRAKRSDLLASSMHGTAASAEGEMMTEQSCRRSLSSSTRSERKQQRQHHEHVYQLPDLRNSKYVNNVRHVRPPARLGLRAGAFVKL